MLRKWLTDITNPDTGPRRTERWKKLGWEVFERKALLLAAAKDLEENNIKNAMKLAATDIFVEKAQGFLTSRGSWLYAIGALTSTITIAFLAGVAWHLYTADPLKLLQTTTSSADVSRSYLVVLILKSTSAGGLVVGIAYFLVSLSRALLHEATVLYSRRHSLRFGRLFVYLMSESMTREDLELVFNWNAEFSTAFKDIRADQVTKSPLTKMLETPVDTIKAFTELIRPMIEATRREEDEKAKAKAV